MSRVGFIQYIRNKMPIGVPKVPFRPGISESCFTRNPFPGLVHTARHTMGAGHARSRYPNRKEGDTECRASDWSEVVNILEQQLYHLNEFLKHSHLCHGIKYETPIYIVICLCKIQLKHNQWLVNVSSLVNCSIH